MLKDPLYKKIIEGLGGHLDPLVFERCMGDLLREDFPGLVPVTGGSDSGMDGAIPDPGGGEPFPLVCTTREDVRRNLRESLEEWKKHHPSQKAALATSRKLTPSQRSALMELAREKGFILIQVVEREGVADRLHGNSRWRKELLQISGQASALTAVPISHRLLVDIEPVGREEDLEWLRNTPGDRVLVGQPGSGKTFLPYWLIRQGWEALFLASEDEGAIADALRDLLPAVVVVDDAHLEPRRLTRLQHLRQEIGSDFEIVAITWEGAREEVIEALGGLPEDRVRKLELMTRKEILQIYEQLGVTAREDLLRDLIDQASNRPGLAVTIGNLWLQGSWLEVLDGTALSRTLLTFFRNQVGTVAAQALASFALGGDRGVGQEAVREFLEVSRAEIQRITAGLAWGGVLSEAGDRSLSVWPRQLRPPLLREVFFSTAGMDYRPILEQVPSLQSTVETLLLAKGRGIEIPGKELRDLVARVGSRESWKHLAALSPEDARWALEQYPGVKAQIAGAALDQIPETAVLKLLEGAEKATGATHSRPDHPIRILEDWVREISGPGEDTWIRRRRQVARAAKRYLDAGGRTSIGVRAICVALNPSLEESSVEPAEGNQVTFYSNLLGLEQLRSIEAIWDEVKGSFHEIDSEAWSHLSTALWNWIYPDLSARIAEVPHEVEEWMHAFARKVLTDLSPSIAGSPGIASALQDLARKLDFQLEIPLNSRFERLYPPQGEREDYERWESEIGPVLDALAEEWLGQEPDHIAQEIVFLETEAEKIDRRWPRAMLPLCQRIAARSKKPHRWLAALRRYGARGDLIEPFLQALAGRPETDSTELLEALLDEGQYAWAATEVVLRLQDAPASLLQKAVERASRFPQLVEVLCLRGQAPTSALCQLLRAPDPSVALAAAIGEWNSEPQREVRPEVAPAWREAILNAISGEEAASTGSSFDYWLGEILATDSELAFTWLRRRLQEPERHFHVREKGPFMRAVSALQTDQRKTLLQEFSKGRVPQKLLSVAVGKNQEVYRALLESDELRPHHLVPLAGNLTKLGLI
jgi:hypothetical protein